MERIAATQPTWTDIISAVAAALAVVGASVTLIFVIRATRYAFVQIEEAKRTRHAEILFRIAAAWESENLVKSRKHTAKAASPQALEATVAKEYAAGSDLYYELITLPTFLEDVGLLEREGAVTIEFVYRRFGTFIPYTYRQWKPSIDYLRQRAKRDDVYREFEALVERVEAYEDLWRPAKHARPR